MTPQVGFDDFVRTRGADLRRLAYLLTFDGAQADELADRTLAQCLARWPRIDPFEDPYDVARALLAARAGRRTFHRRRRPSSGPIDLDDRARDRLLAGLPALTPSQRRVAVLRVVEGMSEKDTADALGRSAKAVRGETLAALARLQAVDSGPGDDRPGGAERARSLRRTDRRRMLAGLAVAAAAAAFGAVTVFAPDHPARVVAAAPAGAPSSLPLGYSLPRADAAPAAQSGGFVLDRGRKPRTYSGHWLYDADTARPLREIGNLDGPVVRVGAAAIDPGPLARIVFVRTWDVTAACAPRCAGHDSADQRPEQDHVWRLYEMDPKTGAEHALTDAALGEGPTQLAFSRSGRRLAVVTGQVIRVLDATNRQVPASVVTFTSTNPTPVLGFATDDGPLLIWETETNSVTVWATRQWVTAIDVADSSRRSVVFDSFEAGCDPTPSLWLASTGQLLLETTCGDRQAPRDANVSRIYTASGTGIHLVETTKRPQGYYEDLALDSSGTVLVRHLGPRPSCGGEAAAYRVSLDGRQSHVLGTDHPRCLPAAAADLATG
ncbi:MAG: sigE 13 [Frankiales bacterium]|nr:sigE 13 [Frankiales bacterium]